MNLGREALVRLGTDVGKWLLAASFFLLPLNGLERVAGQQLGDLTLVLCLIVAVAVVLLRGSLPAVPRWLVASGLLFIGGFLLSEAFTPLDSAEIDRSFPYGSDPAALNLMKLLASLVALPVMVLILAPSWPSIRLLAKAWVIGVSASCLAAFLGASFGWGLEAFFSLDPAAVEGLLSLTPPRHLGLAAHPNSLSISAVLATPILLAWISNPRRLFVGFPFLVLLAWGIVLSGSRTGLVGFILMVVASLAFNPGVRATLLRLDPKQISFQVAVIAVSVLVVATGLSFPLIWGEEGSRDSSKGGEGLGSVASLERLDSSDPSSAASDFERGEAISDSLDLIGARPLTGSGFGLIQATHNIYLQPLLAGGLLALAGFLVAWIGLVWTGLRLSQGARGEAKKLAVALTISIGGYLTMGLLSNGMLDRFLYLGPSLLLALYAASRPELRLVDQEGEEGKLVTSE